MKLMNRGKSALLFVGLLCLSTLAGVNHNSEKVTTEDHGLIFSESHKGCSFFPANNLRFPIRPTGQMSEMTFNNIIKVMQQIYTPVYRQRGLPNLLIFSRWTDDTVNAFAFICNDPKLVGTPNYPAECNRTQMSAGGFIPISTVSIYGGLARHPYMTPEGIVLAACHEIGHHLGGYPRYDKNTSWASTEGQSDYFATSKCARKVFAAMGNNLSWSQRAQVAFEVRNTCGKTFGINTEESAICMRTSMAGLTLARVLASLSNTTDPRLISFTNPDKNIVSNIFEGHPAAQCRLDTYLAGAICRVSATEDFSPNNPRVGACATGRLESIGARPQCWFR